MRPSLLLLITGQTLAGKIKPERYIERQRRSSLFAALQPQPRLDTSRLRPLEDTSQTTNHRVFSTQTHTSDVWLFIGLQQFVAVQTTVAFPPFASERRRSLKTAQNNENTFKDKLSVMIVTKFRRLISDGSNYMRKYLKITSEKQNITQNIITRRLCGGFELNAIMLIISMFTSPACLHADISSLAVNKHKRRVQRAKMWPKTCSIWS